MSFLLESFVFLLLAFHVLADPASVPFLDCFDKSAGDSSHKLNISTVYAQVLDNRDLGRHLNLTVLGSSSQPIVGFTNTSGSLTTLFISTSVLTLNAWTNSTYFCSTLRPPSPLPPVDSSDRTYCPISAGPFAFSSIIPWGERRALTTLTTRLRAVDPFVKELFCVDVTTTPLDPPGNSPYGRANPIFYCTVGLALLYWISVGLARIVTAWNRGIARHDGMWSRARSAGFILASAISGEHLARSPALLRFCTPSMRDVFFHTQWCALLAMIAVQWPPFIYPILVQTAWSTLSFNTTLIPSAASHHWNPLSTTPYTPPGNFSDQFSDRSSPLYIDRSTRNILFSLPSDASSGLSSFAYSIGVRPRDLYPNFMILFLTILGATIVLGVSIGLVDRVGCLLAGVISESAHPITRMTGHRSPAFTSMKESPELPIPSAVEDYRNQATQHTNGTSIFRAPSRLTAPLASVSGSGDRGIHSHRMWGSLFTPGSFHGAVLHGNLVRILVLFHLPLTIFATYHMSLHVTHTSKVLAGLSFCIFSVLIPVYLVVRVTLTNTNKLYAETNTLLSYGPLYNHYRHGSQLFASLLFATNFVFGVTVGGVQRSGMAQAVIILIVEVAAALVTSIWLPWGTGASMGLISFLFCVARIVVAVLLVILTPTIDIGPGPAAWVAYGILVILVLVYVALALMLVVKLIEALVRIAGCIGFDSSKHVVDSGLLGACGLLGCCGGRDRPHKRRIRPKLHQYSEGTSKHKYRDSNISSYLPPIIHNNPGSAGSLPRFQGADSRKDSGASGPPSFLRPEHAMRPYKEDEDDEGFIMGAWQRFSKPYGAPVPVGDSPRHSSFAGVEQKSQSVTTVAQSGFSRIGGGRAHIDSPYAIASGSTYTFPSIGRGSLPQPVSHDVDDSPPPSLCTVNHNHNNDYGTLQPTTTQLPHIRTKSQSAVVEDTSILPSMLASIPSLQLLSPELGPIGGSLHPPVLSSELPANHDDDGDSSEYVIRKKKPWYHIMRHRPRTADGLSLSPPESPGLSQPVDTEFGGIGNGTDAASAQPGRSFVVIRKPPAHRRLSQPVLSNIGSAYATT